MSPHHRFADPHRRLSRPQIVVAGLAAAALATTIGITAALPAFADAMDGYRTALYTNGADFTVEEARNVSIATRVDLPAAPVSPGDKIDASPFAYLLYPTLHHDSTIVLLDSEGDRVRIVFVSGLPNCETPDFNCQVAGGLDSPKVFWLTLQDKREARDITFPADRSMRVSSITGLAPIDAPGKKVVVGSVYARDAKVGFGWSKKWHNRTTVTFTSDDGSTVTVERYQDRFSSCVATGTLQCSLTAWGGDPVIGLLAPPVRSEIPMDFDIGSTLTVQASSPSMVHPFGIGSAPFIGHSLVFEGEGWITYRDRVGQVITIKHRDGALNCDLSQAPDYQCSIVDGILTLTNKTAQFFIDTGNTPFKVRAYDGSWAARRFGVKPSVGSTVYGGAYLVPDVRGPQGASKSSITFKTADGLKEVKVVMDPANGISCVSTTVTCVVEGKAVRIK